MDPKATFKSFIQSQVAASDEVFEQLWTQLRVQSFKKGDVLQTQGDISKTCWFVLSGLLKSVCVTAEGREIILYLGEANSFVSDYVGYLSQIPSRFEISAIESTQCIQIDFSVVARIAEEHHSLNLAFRKILEKVFTDMQQRFLSLLTESALDRLNHFKKAYPDLYKNLSQRNLGAYLGVSREVINRLLKAES